jgi:hypothetical protein
MTDNGIVSSSYLGIQQQALASLNDAGPKALADPREAFVMFMHAGLIPKNFEVGGTSATLPAVRITTRLIS